MAYNSIELVPAGRDKKDASMYKFMRWFIRRHKQEIKDEASKALEALMLYGDSDYKQRMSNGV